MRSKLVLSTAASVARTLYPIADFNTPFTVGQECVLAITKTGDYAGGNVTVEGDNAKDGSFSDIRAAASANAATTMHTEYYNITLGDNLAITVLTRTAGTIEFRLLGDS